LKDRIYCTFSLDIDIKEYSTISLVADGLTLITQHPLLYYSWNHNTVQFDHIHFTNAAHVCSAYSPDGKFFACCSYEDNHVQVWDTRTGQLCGKPIIMPMPDVESIALSSALNNQSLGDQLLIIYCGATEKIALFNIYTGHLYAQMEYKNSIYWRWNKVGIL